MIAGIILLTNIAIVIGWLLFCNYVDPMLKAPWHIYVWSACLTLFSFLDFFHWKLVDSAKNLNQGISSSERNNIQAQAQIRNLKKELRRIWHAGWIFKMILVITGGLFQFVEIPNPHLRNAIFGLSYGLVLGFSAFSVFLWIYYGIFDHLYDRFKEKVDKKGFKEKALRGLADNYQD